MRSLTGGWHKFQWTLHHVLYSYWASKVLNNRIRNSMDGHAATLKRRNYVCNLCHTDPVRVLVLKQKLRRLRTPIFSAHFILLLLELTLRFYSLLCLSFQTARDNTFVDLPSSVRSSR